MTHILYVKKVDFIYTDPVSGPPICSQYSTEYIRNKIENDHSN